MIRGLIYRVDLGDAKRGPEQRGRRYGVVLSRTDWNIVTIVPTSTSAASSPSRVEIEIDGVPTRLLIEQIRSIGVDDIKGEPVGCLSREDMTRLDLAIVRYLGLD
ncbi:type II toxin-antitoxin system PemK/MazF family toxin [Nocardia uniformis]|uniref:Type II toxin-antitoxin system PemK/MazF family toxin n=1 Tax=Nocardia uniformis TaxID=53432 RepID=A0A849CAY2_9NOCA|nr:type II toxin-antitoxin system PemK/MazF family toxin [Nocardia uniformis]NNH75692.1 type II toxin-antitoxin system PemK/MazF family toxin [Nocardia uniformis]